MEKIIKNYKDLIQIYDSIKNKIEERLYQFKQIWENGNDEDIFIELVFCLLTPQSKAKVCWEAVKRIKTNSLLFIEDKILLSDMIHPVRFKNNKAEYIIKAREKFYFNNKFSIKKILGNFPDNISTRSWLNDNIRGIGLKEASHFLRNIGSGNNIAILDRHILKNLLFYEVIDEIPATLSFKKYIEIENKMIDFTKRIKINIVHLDFVLWYKETGEVFK